MVGILAVDPSSPFTGGAILGDRIRMQAHHGDPGVFIRSMASRGSLGGLASTTYEASEALEAAGCDWILIETVGVGQSEMEVVEAADTTVVVLVPESGDAVQVMKAGLMEAGDLFVINKFDREGGDRLEKEIPCSSSWSGSGGGRGRRRTGSLHGSRRICRTRRDPRRGGRGAARERSKRIAPCFERIRAMWTARRAQERLAQRLRTSCGTGSSRASGSRGDLEAWSRRELEQVRRGRGFALRPRGSMFVSRLLSGGNGPHPVGAGKGERTMSRGEDPDPGCETGSRRS